MTDRMTNAEIEALKAELMIEALTEDGDLCTRALTAIRQLQQPWQGIETLPSNLDECALWCTDMWRGGRGKLAPKGYVLGHISDGIPYGNGLNGDWTFTHWMPLPPEPGQ